LVPEVADRYRTRRKTPPVEIWKFNRQVRSMRAGGTLRIQVGAKFRLRWTCDEWSHGHDTDSTPVGTGHEFVDIHVPSDQMAPVRFTFYWTSVGRWEGRDFRVDVKRERRCASGATRQNQGILDNAATSAAASTL
jgi:glucoamylase